ncbi:MAG: hypothetical protein V1754_01835 [Pseudomonadota bacterium]
MPRQLTAMVHVLFWQQTKRTAAHVVMLAKLTNNALPENAKCNKAIAGKVLRAQQIIIVISQLEIVYLAAQQILNVKQTGFATLSRIDVYAKKDIIYVMVSAYQRGRRAVDLHALLVPRIQMVQLSAQNINANSNAITGSSVAMGHVQNAPLTR